MYKPKPLDVVKYTTLDHEWYIVLVYEIQPVEIETATSHSKTVDQFLIKDIAVSNPSDFFDQAIWIEDLFDSEWILGIELLMSNCPDVDTFTTTYPEYLL